MTLRSSLFLLLCLTSLQTVSADPYSLPPRNVLVPMAQIKAICHHYGLTELWQQIEASPPTLPFRSDGCSMWPDSWFAEQDLYEGCFIHDLHYWAGFPGDEIGRLQADAGLMLWVAENVSVELAETMFNGVRMGGSEKLDTPWRWGFGWVE